MPNKRQWLHAEQNTFENSCTEPAPAERDANDAPAEMLFARILAEMPRIEPSANFVERTAQAAWRARVRRRLVARVALIAAAILIALGIGVFELPTLTIDLFVRGIVASSHGLVWLLTSVTQQAGWWSVADRISAVVTDAIAAPAAAALVAALEILALAAIYAFHELGAKGELGVRKPSVKA